MYPRAACGSWSITASRSAYSVSHKSSISCTTLTDSWPLFLQNGGGVSGRQGHANSFPPISFWMTPWLHTIHTFHSPTNTSHHPWDHLMRHISTLLHPQGLNAHSLVQVHDVMSEKKLIIFLSQQLESGGWKTVRTVLLKTTESLHGRRMKRTERKRGAR